MASDLGAGDHPRRIEAARNAVLAEAGIRSRARGFFGLESESLEPPAQRLWRENAYLMTGCVLVNRIYSAIRNRRSILVTGPRGSGKTYCALRAIERARQTRIIGGSHFLQGNREIPRDYLSESTLVIGRDGNAELIEALAWRRPMDSPLDERFQARMRAMAEAPPVNGVVGLAARLKHPLWPAVPLSLPRGEEQWHPEHWLVLMLDEINRFGDGFLDSLLSIMEEGIVIRQGDALRVPLVVVATANPPGYDTTARRLSPPLQARIARGTRVEQPPLDVLVHDILFPTVRRHPALGAPRRANAHHGNGRPAPRAEASAAAIGPKFDDAIVHRVAGCTLCLWGDPRPRGQMAKGAHFLSPETVNLLERAMATSPRLASHMSALSDLVEFGPDARAVSEWVQCALDRCEERMRYGDGAPLGVDDFLDTVLESLGHKLRESFQEGQQPDQMAILQQRIWEITEEVLKNPELEAVFVRPYRAAAERLWGAHSLAGRLAQQRWLYRCFRQLPEERWLPWLTALAALPKREGTREVADWIASHRDGVDADGAFRTDGTFRNEREAKWLFARLGWRHTELAESIRTFVPSPAPPRAAAPESNGSDTADRHRTGRSR